MRRYRTRLAQPFHVDGSDVVGLFCLQTARAGGLSQIASSVTIYEEVARRRPDLEPRLRQPWYFDRYGEERPGERPWFATPILSGLRDRFRFVYLRWYIEKAQSHAGVPRLTDAQVELLDLIDELAHDPAIHLDMDFRPGDIQWLANRTILHSRTAYEDHDDPARHRHLLRLWLTLHRNVDNGTRTGRDPRQDLELTVFSPSAPPSPALRTRASSLLPSLQMAGRAITRQNVRSRRAWSVAPCSTRWPGQTRRL